MPFCFTLQLEIMPVIEITGVLVNFPFEPYEMQKAYMEKVIICLRDGTNGVLESPTGTGKTLSLLCSSLAWLLNHKQQVQSQMQKEKLHLKNISDNMSTGMGVKENIELLLQSNSNSTSWGIPKIIYASRTHSQLTQAMQELKRTSYSFMRAVVLGSRDQLCIHPEVMREQGNANKIQMCKVRVDTRACTYYTRVDSRKDDADFRGPTIMDIEDLVKVGQKLKMCPYYGVKELVEDADIIFMPYNYLLDPIARKANKVELKNTIIILDEAHNIEKICEESASIQIKSSDIAMAIEDTTHIMRILSSSGEIQDFISSSDEPKDFTIDDLTLLKEILLELEKAIDEIVIENELEGVTFPAAYMFELLNKANINYASSKALMTLLDKLVQYLAVESQSTMLRKGKSYQTLIDLLSVVFINKEDAMQKVHKSFKVHVQVEDNKGSSGGGTTKEIGWLSKNSNSHTTKKLAKVINYWCFNPGFGMEQLLNANVRSIILTSGTLSPLKPLIAELALPIAQQLENPHIVSSSQVFVKIIGSGPDREPLISNYQNRDNPKYISSLGSTILNVSRIIPGGLLVFFPSYPLLNQCINAWQTSSLWVDISHYKPIYVEPRGKEEFNNTMEQFYESVKKSKGACFMAVCRGKVSEGLDFADHNGRAVIITGLPFPPFKDPKVILKRKYLEDNRTKQNQLLSGQEWYALDATRAVNQAIGRVIRHRYDYGAILLCDARFQQPSQVQQLSKWIRQILGNQPKSSPFGPVVRELKEFFKNAEKMSPIPKESCLENLVAKSGEATKEISHSKYFNIDNGNHDRDMVKIGKNASSKSVYHEIINVRKTNSIESWSPDDYAKAAGRSNKDNVPCAMDFMSRLNSNVTAIDFNSASTMSMTTPLTQKNIQKRIRNQLEINSSTSLDNQLENVKKKKYKVVANNITQLQLSLPTSSSSSTTTLSGQTVSLSNLSNTLNKFSYNNNLSVELTERLTIEKVAPEDRVDFLRVLRSALSPEDFSTFTSSLISYKRDNTINELMDFLFRVLGKPDLLYMLRGMRRFLKTEHKLYFDERLSKLS